MPRGQGPATVRDMQAGFAGGLNSSGDPNFLRPDQARQMVNFRLTPVGAATKRGGTQIVNTGSTIATPAAYYGTYWLAKKMSIVLDAGVAAFNYSTTTSLPITYNKIIPVAPITDAVPFIGPDSAEWLYLPIPGTPALYRWDGAAGSLTNSTGTLPAAIDSLVVYNDRLWGWIGSAISTRTNQLYYSPLGSTVGTAGGDGIGDATKGGGVIAIRTFGAAAIKSCIPVGASLLIFHDKGVSRLTGFGQDDTSVQPQGVSDSVSVLSRRAVCVYKDTAYFLTSNGLYRATESDFAPVATPETPDPTVPFLNSPSSNVNATCVFNDATQEVYVCFTGTNATVTVTTAYVYNTLLNAWCGPYDGAYAGVGYNAWGTVMWKSYDVTKTANGNFLSQVWFQSGSSGYVYRAEAPYYKDGVASDGTGGSAYTSVLQLHRMYGEDRQYSKAWRWITVNADLTAGATAPTCVASSQNGGNYTMTFSTPIDAQSVYYLQPGGVGPYIDATITDVATAAAAYQTVGVEGAFLGQR